MLSKTALILALFSSLSQVAHASFDTEVSESFQKKEWSNVVSLLKPKEGQNFEHDLMLAKAYLSLERRLDAQKLISEMLMNRRDERVIRLRDIAATQFFDQETANAYYEAIH